jgi:hypothetical protein
MANNFQNGPGGRLVKALSKTTQSASDATSVEMGKPPIIIRPSARIYNEIDDPYAQKVKGDNNFIVNFKPRSIAELTQDQATGGVKPAPIISPYPGKMLPEVVVEAPAAKKEPVLYDETNYLNPFDWKYAVTKRLKMFNTIDGGNIERDGRNRETYSDLISRLEQTPGTLQYGLKNTPYINSAAGAIGDVLLDPFNRVPLGVGAKYGLHFLSKFPSRAAAQKILLGLGDAAPYIDSGLDVIEGVESYNDYPNKPRFEPKKMTPQQKEFLQKLSEYNFGNVK